MILELNKIYLGDNLELLKQLDDNSIDICVSDFPYNLGFMGKKWDTINNYYQWCNDRAIELFRVLKPGAFCLIFSGTRTQHRMVCAFEDAGFEIKDQIMWVYSQGFPKALDISKQFDKLAGAKRKVIGQDQNILKKQGADIRRGKRKLLDSLNAGAPERNNGFVTISADITAPSTDLAKQWEGWKTQLKPVHEPIMMAQKPIEKNYCYNVQKWGVGALNIDGCRIELNGEVIPINVLEKWSGFGEENRPNYEATQNTKGRYPANTIFDEDCGELLNEQSGFSITKRIEKSSDYGGKTWGGTIQGNRGARGHSDSGGASRFFYCAKSSQKDRTENGQVENNHPTVKPTMLMQHLIKLVTPPNGINLDICEGTGTSMKASLLLTKDGYPVNHVGFENDPESYETALKRADVNKILVL